MIRFPARLLPIRLRVALWYAVLLVVTVVAIGIFLLAALATIMQDQMDEALLLRASRVEREIRTGDDGRLDPGDVEAGLLELEPLEEFSSPGIYVQVRDSNGATVASSANVQRGELPITPAMLDAVFAGQIDYETLPTGSEELRVLAWPVDAGTGTVGIVVVGQSIRSLEVVREGMQHLVLVAAAVAALVALVGGWWVTARALGPVADMTRVAREIASTGHFERRIGGPPADDELGRLAATFDEMLGRLEQTLRVQREFLADASHELRGPLMVLRGNLDLLRLGLPEEERRASVREASDEVQRMSRLASDLLFLAAADAEEVVEQVVVELDSLVQDVWERATSVDAGAHELVLGRHDALVVRGDRTRLEQLLWNLVENALRYTPPGGRVELELRAEEECAVLSVADTGVGIEPDHLPRIFDRFYRVDRARSRRQGGTGLGLAIVKRVAEAHGGHVDVESRPGRGSRFVVTLPLVADGRPTHAGSPPDGRTPAPPSAPATAR